MSDEKREYEAKRWLSQARSDINAAEVSLQGESFEWACFQAQQAAEKALKAKWLFHGYDPWGHSLVRLVKEYPDDCVKKTLEEELSEAASILDQYYIPTRYPNGLPDLTPHEVFTRRQAAESLELSKAVIGFIDRAIL